MHMSDALVSPVVGLSAAALSVAAIAYSVYKIKKDAFSEKKTAIMGVSAAFVFAAQMINFTIPVTGSSGHIGGGILLAGLLGGFPALLAMTALLLIQCLIFADGGLLALGCNILNLGVIPCLVIYPLVFKPIINNRLSAKRLSVAAIISAILALQLGALGVVAETSLSGITALPFTDFLLLMQPIHLIIGAVEGIATATILVFIYKMRPEIFTHEKTDFKVKNVIISIFISALILGGGISYFASTNPDGLEWAVEKIAPEHEAEAVIKVPAVMPDYAISENENTTGLAGIIGSIVTLVLAGGVSFVITKTRKKTEGTNDSD